MMTNSRYNVTIINGFGHAGLELTSALPNAVAEVLSKEILSLVTGGDTK